MWRAPEYDGEFPTLGWIVGDWIEKFTWIVLDDDQWRFLAHAYRIDPVTGRRVQREVMLSLPKGAGKTTLVAALCLAEAVGPTRFKRWDSDGEPVAARAFEVGATPWVRIFANSEDQARGNTYAVVARMADELDDPGAPPLRIGHSAETSRKITARGGILIEAATSSAHAADGGRETFSVTEEIHLWISAGMHRLYRTTARNLRKAEGGWSWLLAPTTAWEEGQNSVAEALWQTDQDVRSGAAITKGLLVVHRQGRVDDLSDRPALILGIRSAYGSAADRMDIDGIADMALSLMVEPHEFRRYYLNIPSPASAAWITQPMWKACEALVPPLTSGDAVTLGFDGSRTKDHTALVAVRISDGAAFLINWWNPQLSEAKRMDGSEVDSAVAFAFAAYDVRAFAADVAEWETYIDKWTAEYGDDLVRVLPSSPIAFDQRSRKQATALAVESVYTAIQDREIVHDGNEILTAHVLNARRNSTRWGVSVKKESPESTNKIDALMALVMAWHARRMVILSGWEPQDDSPGFVSA